MCRRDFGQLSHYKQLHRPSDSRADTYAGRVEALIINHDRIDVGKKKIGKTDGLTPDRCFTLFFAKDVASQSLSFTVSPSGE